MLQLIPSTDLSWEHLKRNPEIKAKCRVSRSLLPNPAGRWLKIQLPPKKNYENPKIGNLVSFSNLSIIFRLNPESNAENCPKSKVHDQWVDEVQKNS
jgi:hypothetical protein